MVLPNDFSANGRDRIAEEIHHLRERADEHDCKLVELNEFFGRALEVLEKALTHTRESPATTDYTDPVDNATRQLIVDAGKAARLEAELIRAKHELAGKDHVIQARDDHAASLQDNIAALRQENEELRRGNVKLAKKVEELEQQLAAALHTADVLGDIGSSLRDENEALVHNNDRLTADNVHLKQKLLAAEQTIDTLGDHGAALQDQVAKLEVKLVNSSTAAGNAIQTLGDQVDLARDELKQLDKRMRKFGQLIGDTPNLKDVRILHERIRDLDFAIGEIRVFLRDNCRPSDSDIPDDPAGDDGDDGDGDCRGPTAKRPRNPSPQDTWAALPIEATSDPDALWLDLGQPD